MRYRVAWKNRLTGVSGHGEWLGTNRALAEEWVDYRNRNYTDMNHWIESEECDGDVVVLS